MRSQTTSNIPVLCLSEIGLVHSLSSAHIPILVGSFFKDNLALHSRLATSRTFFSPYDTPQFIDELEEFGRADGRRPVLMSDDDRAILAISNARERLAHLYRFRFPAKDMVARVYDKRQFSILCEQYGLPAPASFAISNKEGLHHLSGLLPFPCIIKPPYKEYWWNEAFEETVGELKKAFQCQDFAQLEALYEKISKIHPSVLVQEFIPGGDHELFSANLYVDADRRIRGWFIGQKLRIYPITAGTGCYVRTVHDETILSLCRDIVDSLSLTGLVNIQFKRNSETGDYRLLEIQFRVSFWGQIGVSSGVNLPQMYYQDLIGTLHPSADQHAIAGRAHVRFFDLSKDIKAGVHYRRAGLLGMGQWLWSYLGKSTYHALRWNDPVPFLMQFMYALKRRLAHRRGPEYAFQVSLRPQNATAPDPNAELPPVSTSSWTDGGNR